MAGISISVAADFGATGWATGEAAARQAFVEGATRAFVYDAKFPGSLFQDREGLIPVTAAGQPVRRFKDRSGQSRDAILNAAATGLPTWQSSGGKSWIEMPVGAMFEIANGLNTSGSWTAVMGVRLDGTSSSSTSDYNLLVQAGGSTSYLAMQLGRNNGNLAQNVATTSGWELQGPAISLATDHLIVGQRDNAAGAARVRLDQGTPASVAYTPGTGTTELTPTQIFGGINAGITVAGRIYYMAFVNLIRDYAAIEAIAAARMAA